MTTDRRRRDGSCGDLRHQSVVPDDFARSWRRSASIFSRRAATITLFIDATLRAAFFSSHPRTSGGNAQGILITSGRRIAETSPVIELLRRYIEQIDTRCKSLKSCTNLVQATLLRVEKHDFVRVINLLRGLVRANSVGPSPQIFSTSRIHMKVLINLYIPRGGIKFCSPLDCQTADSEKRPARRRA